jgi:hypothetical protein
LIWKEISNHFQETPKFSVRLQAIAFAFALLLIAPINLFTLGERRLYLGYLGINVYHNPTILILKPLSLSLFWLITSKSISRERNLAIIGIAILTVISTLAKPSYIICLLPALFIATTIKFLQKQKINLKFLTFGVFIPAIGILFLQYLIAFSDGESGGFIIAPFVAMLGFDNSIFGIVIKFFLSALFPITVAILFPRLVFSNERMIIAWLSFIFGVIYTYCLVETGDLASHGNFLWSGQITLFILFVQTTISLISHFRKKNLYEIMHDPRLVMIAAIFVLHLLSGVLWYLAEVGQPHQWWGKGYNY